VDDWNNLLDHGLERCAAYVIRVNGSYYEAINGSTGVITYGGSNDAGGSDGTDADVVINAALSAVETAGGGGLYFKYGTYTIDAKLSVPSNTWMKCDRGTKIALANSADCFILRAKGADAGAPVATSNVWIEGFEFDGNGSNQAANGQLSLTAIQNWRFTHNYVHDTRATAIFVQPIGDPETPTHGCDYNLFDHNRIIDQSAAADMFIMGMRYSTVAYNYLSGTQGSYMLSGGAHSQGLRVIGNTLRSGGLTGIGLESSQRVLVEGNDIDGMVGHGIYVLKAGAYAAPENIIIRNNIVQGSTANAGIYIAADCSNIDVTGNHCFDNDDAGITLYNCQQIKILNNIIYNNDQGGNAVPNMASTLSTLAWFTLGRTGFTITRQTLSAAYSQM
jgi:parallel beta-helix repeat protein